MKKLRVLDLFSGIGGFSLGLERTGGFETAAFCEYAEFPRKVLAKHWPDVPIYPDVRELTAERIDADGLGRIDLICGGYPCQPFSHAGKRLGAEDDRHLWPEMCRLVKTLRPAWVIGENVAGHVSMGLDDVLSDLDGLGYAAQAFVIPACAVNAPHRRDRVWVVAHSVSQRSAVGAEGQLCGGTVCDGNGVSPCETAERDEFKPWVGRSDDGMVANASDVQRDGGGHNVKERMGREQVPESGNGGGAQTMANTKEQSLERRHIGRNDGAALARPWKGCEPIGGSWCVEPNVGRVAHGVSNRVDRLKALGNAVVPQIPEMIGRAILQGMEAA